MFIQRKLGQNQKIKTSFNSPSRKYIQKINLFSVCWSDKVCPLCVTGRSPFDDA